MGKVQQALDDFLLLCRPRVPALNRWTRVYQPTAWWTLALALLGVIPRCWSHLSQPAPPDLIAAATGDGAGPATEFTYRAQQRVRWNKATAWLVDVRTLPRLLTCTTLMLPALDIMADIFCANKKNISVINFADWDTSPAVHAIREYADMLQDLGDPRWLPVRLGKAWCEESLARAFQGAVTMIGHVFLRVVVPFRGWPWYLARLVNDSTVAFDKNQIADRFWKSSSCCMDDSFSLKFRATLASAADITSARSLLILKNVFSNVPVNNVKCETQFGRQRNAASAGRGQAPDCSTLASKHVLSEMIHLYRKRALEKQARLAAIVPLADARIVRKHNLKRKVCGWNMFVHKNRARLASGLSMSALSA